MNTIKNEVGTATVVSMRRRLCRASSAAAVVAVVAAAIGMQVIAPEPTFGSSSMVAIARADCPPDCGGGPGNGGMPSGPPGGGTEFVPPSMPAMPSYDPSRGQPPLDQNNGISIYNSAAPQPSQAAQPSQQPVQNQDGSYSRAANGEQQPINYSNAPDNQQLNSDWQKLGKQLDQQGQEQPGQDSGQSDQTDDPDSDHPPHTCSVDFSAPITAGPLGTAESVARSTIIAVDDVPGPLVPLPSPPSPNRDKAVKYAEQWADLYNTDKYVTQENSNDCTNFVSQVMEAGNFPQTGNDWTEWHGGDPDHWYHDEENFWGNEHSTTWTLARANFDFITKYSHRGNVVGAVPTGNGGLDPLAPSKAGLKPGDLMFYRTAAGEIDHAAVYLGTVDSPTGPVDVRDQHSTKDNRHAAWMPQSHEYLSGPAEVIFVHLTYPGE